MKCIAPSILLLLSGSLAGCLSSTEDLPLERRCTAVVASGCDVAVSGESRRFAIDQLTFSAPDPFGDPNIVEGFDLDCRRSDDDDDQSCFKLDFISPDGVPGIDNQAGILFATLGMGPALFGSETAIVEVAGIDDPARDACVSMQLRAATRGPTGELEVGELLGSSTAAGIEEGRVVAFFDTLRLSYRFSSAAVLDGTLVLQLADVRVAFDLREDALVNGVIGGGLPARQISEDYAALDPEIPLPLATSITEGQADLHVDPETGACDRLSAGLTASAVAL